MKTRKSSIEQFLLQKKIAVLGVSRSGKKFGNSVMQDLQQKGYQTFAVNPYANEINGRPCYASLESLPEKMDGVVFVIPPEETEKQLPAVSKLGIRHVWLQQGSESKKAIDFCDKNNINYVAGECIFMFNEPVTSFHKFHQWIWKLLGKLPK